MFKGTVWIAGASGKLGSTLVKKLKKESGIRLVTTDKDLDITDFEKVEQTVQMHRPEYIINCTGLSSAYCEEHMVEAFKVHALGARNLANASRLIGATLIHMSTDDVFHGTHNEAFTEYDQPMPVTIYGKSKLAGENYVRELNPKHIIIRSSWVYGMGTGGDYLSYVLEKGKNGEAFEAPCDQFSTPTSASEVAHFISDIIKYQHKQNGIFHVSCEGMCSRYEFARAVLGKMGYDSSLVKRVFSNKDGTTVSTHLETLMIKMTGIYVLPSWENDLEGTLIKIKNQAK